MTVIRATPTSLQREERGYAVLPSDSIRLIRSGDALAIWAYLQSKPTDWIVRRPQIMERLDLSRRRYADAMKHLRDVGLVEAVATSDPDTGILTGKRLICRDSPNIPNPVHSVGPNIPVSERSVSATFGESAHIQIIDKNINNRFIQRGEKDGEDKKPARFAHPSHKPYTGPAPDDGDPNDCPAMQILRERERRAAAKAGTA